ncbi:MAG TPA: IclR family transcriptional regulator C-terminal domain-containing protein [Solirubrobacterales bacterium]|jgi:IclR family pca regulon transcriptional regulator|nr:IclR family transcriptional regulator C-terminal domain-containing protein [Solirubrobacterales bacterium]
MTESKTPNLSRHDYVQSLERGLSVLRAFNSEQSEMRLSEVAAETGLTRAAARRFLLTLVELGYVQVEDGRFSLRPRVLDLGYAYLSGLSFAEIAQPHMEILVRSIKESSSISVLDDLDIVYVVRVPTRRIMTITLAVGTRLPAYATSMGRILLAQLPAEEREERLRRVRLSKLTSHTVTTKKKLREEIERAHEQGFAMVDQELEEGLRSAAVPIVDSKGEVAALNISVHASRASMKELREQFLPQVQATATAIEADTRSSSAAV